jgi:hypothetical protein
VANSISTNTLTTVTASTYTYLAQATTPNTPEYLPGDGTLVVPDFDSYVMFDFSQKLPDNTTVETDLSSAGVIYLTFVDDQRQVKIPSLDKVANANKVIGQVVFKISSDQSSAIFQLSNRYYFVSSAVSVGSAVVNETVIYSGIWQKANEPERVTYSDRLRQLKTQDAASKSTADALQKEVDDLLAQKKTYSDRSTSLDKILSDLKNQIGSTSDEISQIESKIEKQKEDAQAAADAAAQASADAKAAQAEADAKKSKRRKAKVLENKHTYTFWERLSGMWKNPIGLIGFVVNPFVAVGQIASAASSRKYSVTYELELEDTKEKVKIRGFKAIYSDRDSFIKNVGVANAKTGIDDSWFSIKDSEGARPAAGTITWLASIEKRLDQFDSKDQFKTMVGTDPVIEPPAAYNDSDKSAAAFYLGGNDLYYYKYVTYARDVDPQKKITEIIGEVEL